MPPTPELVPERQRRFAVAVVQALRAAGHEAYWAGGCVRDRLLGIEPKDYDVATSATPDEVQQVFRGRRTLAIGAAFGVIAVVGPRTAGQIEVATFRQDTAYSDGRRPDAVVFSRPEQDAQRRDFTINGLFYDPLNDRVIDFVGGEQDLRAGVIRAIGDPGERFREDKLRLLRAVRFASRFGFQLEVRTRQAVQAMAAEITVVSAERIAQEMRAMLVHPARRAALAMLWETELLAAVLPEAVRMRDCPWPSPGRPTGDLWEHTLAVLALLHAAELVAVPADRSLGQFLAVLDLVREPAFALALAALLVGVGRAAAESQRDRRGREPAEAIAESVCRRWKLSNDETDHVVWLVGRRNTLTDARSLPWPRLQRLLISDGILDLLALHEADCLASGRDLADVEHCRRRLSLPRQRLNPPPLITGDDLIAHGVPAGKRYKLLLDSVRDAQLEDRIHTKAQALELVDRLKNTPDDDRSTGERGE